MLVKEADSISEKPVLDKATRRASLVVNNVYIQPLSLEEGKATHSSILAWRIPWIEEPGGLQSMGSQIVGYD